MPASRKRRARNNQSDSEEEKHPGPMPAPTRYREPKLELLELDGNYELWALRIQNELFRNGAEAIFTQALPNADGTEKEGRAPGVDDFAAVHRTMPPKTALALANVPPGDVEQLLRRVRRMYYHPGSQTVGALSKQLVSCKLVDFDDAQFYAAKIERLINHLAMQGESVSDRMALHHLLEGLPDEYDPFKDRLNEMSPPPTIEVATQKLIDHASCHPNLPGAIAAPGTSSKRNDQALKTKELCRNFARTGSCRFGTRCRFEHVAPPASSSTGSKSCKYCKKPGHTVEECRRLKRKKEKEAEAAKAAKEEPAAAEQANVADELAEDLQDFEFEQAFAANETKPPRASPTATFNDSWTQALPVMYAPTSQFSLI